MKTVRLAVVALLLGSGLVGLVATARHRVYTVPEVLAGLARDPASWIGQTALVWGTALELVPGCPHSQWCPTGLYKPGTTRPGPILLLEKGPSNPLTARLRTVPLLQAIVPAPQHLHLHTPSTYLLLFSVVPNTGVEDYWNGKPV